MRCGHYEQKKVRGKWKCVACGKTLTVQESVQNSIDLSKVMNSAIVSGRTLDETLDDLLGRKEWEEIRSKIPTKSKSSSRTKSLGYQSIGPKKSTSGRLTRPKISRRNPNS
jgi:capsular polysaccharide biosynthesis protein